MNIDELEFDAANREHLATHGIDDNLVWEVVLDSPAFFENPPRANRSGSHLMVGFAASRRLWTIVIVTTDEARSVWRPITGWPSTGRERKEYEQAIAEG